MARRLMPYETTQSISTSDMLELTYKIDLALVFKLAQLYVGESIILDKFYPFEVYEYTITYDDVFLPLNLYLEWTGLGYEEDAYTSNEEFGIRQFKIGCLEQIKNIIESCSAELQDDYETLKRSTKNISLGTENSVNFEIDDETGLLCGICEYMVVFEWHIIIPKIHEFLKDAEQFYQKCLKERAYYENSSNI